LKQRVGGMIHIKNDSDNGCKDQSNMLRIGAVLTYVNMKN
jgi:hypothetical protein